MPKAPRRKASAGVQKTVNATKSTRTAKSGKGTDDDRADLIKRITAEVTQRVTEEVTAKMDDRLNSILSAIQSRTHKSPQPMGDTSNNIDQASASLDAAVATVTENITGAQGEEITPGNISMVAQQGENPSTSSDGTLPSNIGEGESRFSSVSISITHNFSQKLKSKIWMGEYIELSSLLDSQMDSASRYKLRMAGGGDNPPCGGPSGQSQISNTNCTSLGHGQ